MVTVFVCGGPYKLDDVREALRRGDIRAAIQHGRGLYAYPSNSVIVLSNKQIERTLNHCAV
jgi:hypothetical protein